MMFFDPRNPLVTSKMTKNIGINPHLGPERAFFAFIFCGNFAYFFSIMATYMTLWYIKIVFSTYHRCKLEHIDEICKFYSA